MEEEPSRTSLIPGDGGIFPPGTRIGRYEIRGPIGIGGMAQIYGAVHRGPNGLTPVALKHLLPHHASREDFVRMFIDEARVAARVRHRNVIRIFELLEERGAYFIAMEYVHGMDLRDAMKAMRQRRTRMPLAFAVAIIRDACRALEAAHQTVIANRGGLIHRDVTPRNILLSTSGTTKLTDFGIAKATHATRVTAEGVVKGKLPYLAPEQLIRGATAVDHRVDIFAAGVCLYELVAGAHPFRAATDFAAMKAILAGERPPISKYRPECPPELDAVIGHALARDREERYATAKQMGDALDALLSTAEPPYAESTLGHWVASLKGEDDDWLDGLDPNAMPQVADADLPNQTATGEVPSSRGEDDDEKTTGVQLPASRAPR